MNNVERVHQTTPKSREQRRLPSFHFHCTNHRLFQSANATYIDQTSEKGRFTAACGKTVTECQNQTVRAIATKPPLLGPVSGCVYVCVFLRLHSRPTTERRHIYQRHTTTTTTTTAVPFRLRIRLVEDNDNEAEAGGLCMAARMAPPRAPTTC